ncbi:hypothetical protein FRC02_010227 [Tulasnella sp. 418]|nr:hypothetical protein FRC02_010227 [Tulasnella sp. 418]
MYIRQQPSPFCDLQIYLSLLLSNRTHMCLQTGPQQRGDRRRYAVLIGIGKYEDQKRWSILEGAHNDLELYRKILQNAYNFDDKDIVELSDEVDPSSPLYPNGKNIVSES